MSEIVKMIGEMVVDKFPVVLIIGIFLTLVFSGGLRDFISMLSNWMLG